MPDEEKYEDLKKILKSLPKVKARGDFEAKLFHRLRDIEAGKSSIHKLRTIPVTAGRFNWLTNILKPAYASAIGVTVILLICVVLYVSYLPNKTQNTAPVTQSSGLENKQQENPVTPGDQGITKREAPSLEEHGLKLNKPPSFLPETEKPSSDFEVTIPPTVTPSESPSPTMRSVEAEPKSSEIEEKTEGKIDDLKKAERKEAPELKKEKGEDKLDKDEVMQKSVAPSVNEQNVLGKDSSKLDSVKIIGKMKKIGKKAPVTKDSLKNQPTSKPPVNDEKLPDTSK